MTAFKIIRSSLHEVLLLTTYYFVINTARELSEFISSCFKLHRLKRQGIMAGAVDRCCGCSEFISRKFWAALLAELIGTMFLVVGACGSALAPAKLCGANGGSTVQISLGFGFSVATMVWATAHVSGGHINPAVSFGMVITRKISVLRFILYVLCQCGGAIAGAAILKYTVPDEGTIGTSQLGHNVSAGQGFGIELLITFVLVLTVFSCVDPGRTDKGGSIPLTIGISIAMCHLWAVSKFNLII